MVNASPTICQLSCVMKIDTKSAIIVVEDDCTDSVGNHSEKDGNGQNPSLWKFWIKGEHFYVIPKHGELSIKPSTEYSMWYAKQHEDVFVRQLNSSPVTERIPSQIFFQHFPPLATCFFTLLASIIVIFSLSWSFFKSWWGIINDN